MKVALILCPALSRETPQILIFAAKNKEPEKPSVSKSQKPPASALELEKSASPQVQKALRDLKWLKSVMLRYRRDVGELPPRGDYCPACMGRKGNGGDHCAGKDPRPHMAKLEQALMKKDGRGWKGPYIKKLISKDPWGMEYTYDDNGPKGTDGGDTYL